MCCVSFTWKREISFVLTSVLSPVLSSVLSSSSDIHEKFALNDIATSNSDSKLTLDQVQRASQKDWPRPTFVVTSSPAAVLLIISASLATPFDCCRRLLGRCCCCCGCSSSSTKWLTCDAEMTKRISPLLRQLYDNTVNVNVSVDVYSA